MCPLSLVAFSICGFKRLICDWIHAWEHPPCGKGSMLGQTRRRLVVTSGSPYEPLIRIYLLGILTDVPPMCLNPWTLSSTSPFCLSRFLSQLSLNLCLFLWFPSLFLFSLLEGPCGALWWYMELLRVSSWRRLHACCLCFVLVKMTWVACLRWQPTAWRWLLLGRHARSLLSFPHSDQDALLWEINREIGLFLRL